MKKLLISLFIMIMFGFANGANALTISFEHGYDSDDQIYMQEIDSSYFYDGLYWGGYTQMGINSAEKGGFYANSVVSGNYAGFGQYNPSITTPTGTSITLNSAYFSLLTDSILMEGNITDLDLKVSGYTSSSSFFPTYEEQFKIYLDTPTFVKFDWEDVNKISFQAKNGSAFGIDDMVINESIGVTPTTPTPEPASIIFGIMSLTGALGLRKRTQKA